MASSNIPDSQFQLNQFLKSNSSPTGDAIDLPDDVYDRIVRQVREICHSVQGESEPLPQHLVTDDAPPTLSQSFRSEVRAPVAPRSLDESGLTLNLLSELILKFVYLNGSMTGFEIAKQLRLPFSVVDDGLAFLKHERCLEVQAGELAGRLSYRFQLTDFGRKRSREAFDECRYVGPAPVSLSSYQEQCLRQSTREVPLTPVEIRDAFRDLVIEESLISRIGPAILSGQSVFLFGPPGNGKTMIAKAIGRLMNECGGEIYVPYAVQVDRHIVTVFDPSIHRSTTQQVQTDENAALDSGVEIDQRWRKVRRPVVITGGELSLEMLDLGFHSQSGYYTAPLHLKSNGGVFLLDDFGRQLVPPAELLNRWILPLEERIDFLTLASGKKFAVPFEQLIIFSTNLAPSDLVDQAFLRRIRHKIPIESPSEQQFRQIFRRCCHQRGIRYDDWIVGQLFNNHYDTHSPPKSSDPRDLLDITVAICRFNGEEPHLSEEILAEAWKECHGGL